MRLCRVRIALCVAATLGSALVASPGNAAEIFENLVFTSAAVLDVDPSSRSVGMGGASTAVFWGDGPNDWANPALLGTARGIRYVGTDVERAPDSFLGSNFRSQRLILGGGGVGVALTGEPINGLGEQRLESSTITFDDGSGGIESIQFKQTERSWGAGISLAQGFGSLARWRGHEAPAWTRRGDVAFGLNRKTVADYSADPANPDRLTAYDWGALARAWAPLRHTLGSLPRRFELAYALAVVNANDAGPNYAPTARQHRNGAAMRMSVDDPETMSKRLPAWLAPGVSQLASLGIAYDISHITAGSRDSRGWSINSWGAELSLGGLLFARVGGAHNSGTSSTNNTWGLGAVLPIGHWGAVHYDYARVDRPFGGPMAPQSWAVVVDPVAIARGL